MPVRHIPTVRRIETHSFVHEKYKGKEMHGMPRPFADMEIEEAGPDMSYARILQSDGPLKRNDKVLEKLQEVTQTGG